MYETGMVWSALLIFCWLLLLAAAGADESGFMMLVLQELCRRARSHGW
jgi:hypothetical protein